MAQLRRTCNEERQRTSKHKHKRPKWNLSAASCPKSLRTSYFMAAKCCNSVRQYEYNPFDLQHFAIHHCIAIGDMRRWYLVLGQSLLFLLLTMMMMSSEWVFGNGFIWSCFRRNLSSTTTWPGSAHKAVHKAVHQTETALCTEMVLLELKFTEKRHRCISAPGLMCR